MGAVGRTSGPTGIGGGSVRAGGSGAGAVAGSLTGTTVGGADVSSGVAGRVAEGPGGAGAGCACAEIVWIRAHEATTAASTLGETRTRRASCAAVGGVRSM